MLMRKAARELEVSARTALQQLAQRRSSASEVWRARLALAFYQGAGYRQISARFGCGQATVARWVGRFRAAGVEGLQARPHPRGTGPRQRLLQLYLPATVHQSPRALGQAQDRWTLRALQQHCEQQTGQRPSLESIRRALKRFGYSWKRAKRTVTSPDPDYAAKKGQ
jgi:transposase